MTAPELLADMLALAIVAHGPSSGSDLSAKVRVRKQTVLRELRTNPRFESVGRGRGSKWRLAGNREWPPVEPVGTDPTMGVGVDVLSELRDHLERLEHRVAAVEHRLDERATLEAEAS
jgi:hypothetical protein